MYYYLNKKSGITSVSPIFYKWIDLIPVLKLFHSLSAGLDPFVMDFCRYFTSSLRKLGEKSRMSEK